MPMEIGPKDDRRHGSAHACVTGGSMKNRLAIVGILVGVVPNAIGGAMAAIESSDGRAERLTEAWSYRPSEN